MTKPELRVTGLTKRYKQAGKEVVAADAITFAADGGVVGILGPNGSGKTTTIKSILGLVTPDAGAISLCGFDPVRDRRELLHRCGAVLEGARNIYWRLTVRENIDYFAGIRGLSRSAVKPRSDRLLETLLLTDRAKSRVGTLSRGYQQRAAIACALAHSPRVVFLDEPTLGLDVESRGTIEGAVRSLADDGTLVVVTSHDMGFIERSCDRALVIRSGKIVADDTIASLKKQLVGQTLVLEMPSDHVAPVVELLSEWTAYSEERQTGTAVMVPLDKPADAYIVLKNLGDHREHISGIAVRDNDFESAFVRLLSDESANSTHPKEREQ
jgi:ABC-2 type transport system ATP-binding protein